MMKYKKYKTCFDVYCGVGPYDDGYDHQYFKSCEGDCDGNSFCDSGVCRCYSGYYPYNGACLTKYEAIADQDSIQSWNDYRSWIDLDLKLCNSTNDCKAYNIDMNL